MELLDASRSVVVVIDFQGKLVEKVYRSGLAVAAARRLLAVPEIFGVPVKLRR